MFLLFVASIAATSSGRAAVPSTTKLWQITRYDYREFCSDDKTTIDLRTGNITAFVGACYPNRGAASKRVEGRVNPVLLRSLREAARNPNRDRFIDTQCEKRAKASPYQTQVLSGAGKWIIEQGPSKVVITLATPCLTETAQTLIEEVDDAVRGLNIHYLR
jgi:hypothetical protein